MDESMDGKGNNPPQVSRSRFGVTTRQWGARLRAALKVLPVLGPLAHCGWKHHRDALKEFFFATLFGTATFWLTAFLLLGFATHSNSNYFDLLYITVSSGQLFIFAVGLVGPIVLSTADDPDRSDKFPGRSGHITVLIILCIAASSFYSLELASREPAAATMFDKSFLFRASLAIAATVVVMRYLTIVYRKSTLHPDAPAEMKSTHQDFSEKFSKRHRSGQL